MKKKTEGAVIPVAIIMGSESDRPIMKEAADALHEFQIGYAMAVISAHRTPHEMFEFAQNAREKGYRVIIAGAGGAAHLPGMVASVSELPVIGVPIPTTSLQGQDSLLSIVQMPKGVPVATVAIGNAWNAGVLAAQILGAGTDAESQEILRRVRAYKETLRAKVLEKNR